MKTLTPENFFTSLSRRSVESRRPEAVTFELTYGCNLRCVHCYNPTHRVMPEELTTTEVTSILHQVAELGVLHLTFSGGEPFTRPDLSDILLYARRLGFVLHILTNATRVTPKATEVLEEVGVNRIMVSMYGATEPTYERMTGVPGSYASFRNGLRYLAARSLPVIVRMPVTTLNCGEVEACRRLIEPYGWKFQYSLDIMPKTDGDKTPLQYRLSPEDKIAIDRARLYNPNGTRVEEPCLSNDRFIECACGRSRFAITPYGEMNLCVAFPIPKYNLRTGTVKEGWEILKQIVDAAKPNANYACPTCDVRPHCRQGRSDAWLETGDMSACLPHFKALACLEAQTYDSLDGRRPGGSLRAGQPGQ